MFIPHIHQLNPKLPYSYVPKKRISNNFRITVKGHASKSGNSFAVDVLHGENNEIAYHFRPYFNNVIVQNNFRRGLGWQNEENVRNKWINADKPFTIVITSNDEGYKTEINEGKQMIFFKHRVPPPVSGFIEVRVKCEKISDANISEIIFEVPSSEEINIISSELNAGERPRMRQVLFPYSPVNEDELKLEVGENVEILTEVEDGWCRGKIDGRVGVFPLNFVSNYEPNTNILNEVSVVAMVSENGLPQYKECKVEYEYPAEQEDELDLKVGDIITNVVPSTEGWLQGTLRGKRGLFPDNFVKFLSKSTETINLSGSKLQEKNTVTLEINSSQGPRIRKVLFSYSPTNEDELKLEVGEIVEIIMDVEDGWCRGKVKGREGVFPSNFVSDYEPTANEINESLVTLKTFLEKAKESFNGHPQLLKETLDEWKSMKLKLTKAEDLLTNYGHLFDETVKKEISTELNVIKTIWKDVKEMKRKYEVPAPKAICPICQDEEVNFILNCGHPYCEQCAKQCKTCPICREDITKMTKIYWSM